MAARLVVVTGGKAGPGATTLAVGLAGAWAVAGRRVLLVDLGVVWRRCLPRALGGWSRAVWRLRRSRSRRGFGC